MAKYNNSIFVRTTDKNKLDLEFLSEYYGISDSDVIRMLITEKVKEIKNEVYGDLHLI